MPEVTRTAPTDDVSPVVTDRVRVVHDLRVPMRDGVRLSLDLVRPDLDAPAPVALVRTPYDKTRARVANLARYEDLARRGYVVALNDCRGRFNSDGVFMPYFNEHDDGYDVVEWIAAQPWCDGNVGMLGGSYAGQVQWQAAARTPPHLRAIVPVCSPPSSLWRNEPIFNGLLMMGFGEWMTWMGRRTPQTDDTGLLTGSPPYYDALPVAELPGHAGVTSAWWGEFMAHPTYDEFWARGGYDDYEHITVPALNVTGWWDLNFPGAPENFAAMRARGATADARDGQLLVIGPWPHAVNQRRTLSGVDFGPDAVIDLDTLTLRFLDRWLRGRQNGIDDEARVQVFMVGENRWRSYPEFPVPGTQYRSLFLHSDGAANTLLGDGTLTTTPPTGDEPDDRYVYDPADVGRPGWNITEGPVDDRIATIRDDVLSYASTPLTEALDVIGWVSLTLHAASSATDTDWHARLVDIHPDGTARFLCRGALRARFRESLTEPVLLEPDVPALFEFTLDATGVRFLPGHRIGLEIASSWFPQYDRNLGGGTDNPFHESTPVVSWQRILHRPGAESRVVLPVVPIG